MNFLSCTALSRGPARPAFRPLLLGSLLLGGLTACGGGGTPAVEPVVTPPTALAVSQPGELLRFVQDRLRAGLPQRVANLPVGDALLALPTAPPSVAAAAGAERSGTAVQEQGVDEDDLIKSEGDFIYTLDTGSGASTGQSRGQLRVHHRRSDGRLDAAVDLALPPQPEGQASTQGLLLASASARAAVLGGLWVGDPVSTCPKDLFCPTLDLLPFAPMSLKRQVLLDLIDIADPTRPKMADQLRIDGWLVGSRLIGNALVLVTQHAPTLALDRLPATASAAERDAAIAGLKPADLLPTVRINGADAEPLLAETDCTLQASNASTAVEFTTITVFDLAARPLRRTSRCFVGGSEALYMSATHLYLATTRYAYVAGGTAIRYAPQVSTDIHKFALGTAAIDYRGSGQVSGHLGWDAQRKSYRMSEFNGDLRVLSFTGEQGWAGEPGAIVLSSAPPSPATLTVLRERSSDKSLQVLATLPNARRPQSLGHAGEQVHAVRFLGARGYVVTFRQTDPLYVLDLSDPADPKSVGELKMPGFSDHLYPIGEALLLGVGKDATDAGAIGGVKVALFDVADAARPQQLAAFTYGHRGSHSGVDLSPHGLNIFVRGTLARIGLPLLTYPSGEPGLGNLPKQGLQRFEVDVQARTMRERPMLAPPSASPTFDLSGDRSLQIEAQVYYLSGGQLGVFDW